MTLRMVDVGIAPNDGTGDNIRDAFVKVNENMVELNTLLYQNTTFDNATIQSLVADTVTIATRLEIPSGADSFSSEDGALVIAGGIGVGGNAHVGGNLYATNAFITNDTHIGGNLVIDGNQVNISTTSLNISDVNITLAKGVTTATAANGAGITVDGPANATIIYTSTNDRWNLNKDLTVPNIYTTNITGTLQTNAQPNITSVGQLSGLAVSGLTALGNMTAASITTSNATVTGGSINGTKIGNSNPSTGAFTTISASSGITGTLQTSAQPNITSVGTLTGLTVNGTLSVNSLDIPSGANATMSLATISNAQITGGNITNTPISGSTGSFTTLTANSANITTISTTSITSSAFIGGTGSFTTLSASGGITGTVQTNAQPYITSVGTLTNLTTSGNATIGTDLIVGGNLTVQGTSTILNTSTIDVEDINITIAKGATTAAAANGAGITVDGPAGATITYTSANDRWNMNRNLVVPTVFSTLNGNVATSSQPYITSVGTLTSLNTSGNITSGSNFVISNLGKGIFFADGSYQDTKYVLPMASETGLGGVKVGTGLLIDTNGILSVNSAGGSQSFTDLVVTGNLTVQGSTTTINAATLEVADTNIVVARNATTAAAANGAGLTVNGAGATITYLSSTDRWTLNKNLTVGTVYGNLSGNVTGNVTGNASTATKLATARTISLTGDVTGSGTFDGSANLSIATTIVSGSISANNLSTSGLTITVATGAITQGDANGAGLLVGGSNASLTYSSADDRWNLNKNLNVGTVYGALSGNASTASALQTTRYITLSSDITANVAFDGSGNATAAATLSNSGVTAGMYGSTTNVPRFTVDAKGRVTTAANIAISFPVTGVNNQFGNVQLTTDNIGEGTTNKYYTDTRARASLSAGTGITYNSTTGVISSSITQFTTAMARSSISATAPINYDVASGVISTALTQYTDTNARNALSASNGISYNSSTGAFTGSYTGSTGVTITGAAIAIGQAVSTSDSPTFNGLTVPSITHSGTSGVGDIGSNANKFGTFYGVASTALYADLAEKYESDAEYPVGTVVVFGGDKEITQSTEFADVSVAGTVSENPAYLMNADCEGQAIALRGRVPVRVVGPVKKGDLLVSSDIPGCAVSVGKDGKYGIAVLAKSLETSDDTGEKLIEAVII